MLGSANFEAGPALRFMSGNLCHQIEHHLYPDLPSNRLYEISIRVQQLCDKYDLPYTTGSFPVQYGKTWRTIAKLSLPDRFLRDTADDAPETRSERMFAELGPLRRNRGRGRSEHRAQARAQDRGRGRADMAPGTARGQGRLTAGVEIDASARRVSIDFGAG